MPERNSRPSDRREPEAIPVELDAMLDEALRLTFPASDPIALHLEDLAVGRPASPTAPRRAAKG
jgi:hypothetical protein